MASYLSNDRELDVSKLNNGNRTNSPFHESHRDNDRQANGNSSDPQEFILARNVAEDNYWRRYARSYFTMRIFDELF